MKAILHKWKLQQDTDRIEVLHMGHLFFVLLAMVIGVFSGKAISSIIQILVLIPFYYLFTKTKKSLFYSFWTFASLLLVYFLFKIFTLSFFSTEWILFALALIVLIIEMYMLFSPIYYPRVSWWEYDFRYRNDLKIEVNFNESKFKGRLTDLRRQAGCVLLFEDLEVGNEIEINDNEAGLDFKFNLEIMSKRRYSLGRPIHYGVKFLFPNRESKLRWHEFVNMWSNIGHEKRMTKFKKDTIQNEA
ncbi:PilZ domain-containing protein [Bacteriovoracaceae bacterium]|nr:PilZ domain-containing protein [Bacteriovoracaceae bacterium]|tara:strand:+ start:160082 stop:160816 length:735 start_codon:yes stop_codon:yes gene_type:complete